MQKLCNTVNNDDDKRWSNAKIIGTLMEWICTCIEKVMHTHQGTLIVVKQNHKSSQIKKTMDNTN